MKKIRKSIAVALVLSLFIGNISSVALARGIGDLIPDFGKKISVELSFYDDYSKVYDGTTAAEDFDLSKGKLNVSKKSAKTFFDRNEDKFPGCNWPDFDKDVCQKGISLNSNELYIKSADVFFEDADVAKKSLTKKKVMHIDNIVWDGTKLPLYSRILDLPTSALAEGKIEKALLKLGLPELVTKVYDGNNVKKNVPVVINRDRLPECDKDAVIEVSGIFNSEDAACAKIFTTGLTGIKEVENIDLANYRVLLEKVTKGQILPAGIEGLSDQKVEYKAEDKGFKSFDIDKFGVIPENIRGEWEITGVTDPSEILVDGKAKLGALTDNVIYKLSDTEDGGEAVITLKFTSKYDCSFKCRHDKSDAEPYGLRDCCDKEKDKCDIKRCGEGNYVQEVKLTITKAEKEPVVVERDLTVDYVLEDKTLISSEVIKVQNGTTVITYEDLEAIPEGYQVVDKNDRSILDTTTKLEIVVEKINDKPDSGTDPSDRPDPGQDTEPGTDPSDEEDPQDRPESGDKDDNPQDKPSDSENTVDADKTTQKADAKADAKADVKADVKVDADKDKGTPETGDDADLIAYMALLMLAGSGAFALKRRYDK